MIRWIWLQKTTVNYKVREYNWKLLNEKQKLQLGIYSFVMYWSQ